MREEPEDRRNTVETAMLDSHPARTKAQRELKVLGEIQPQNSEAVELVGRVVGLIAEPRIVADAEESLGGIFLEIEASLERPPLLARAPGLVVDIDPACDLLLRACHRIPIGIFRGIGEKAEGPARA